MPRPWDGAGGQASSHLLARGPLRSLRYRDYRILVLSLAGAWTGFFLQLVAQGWLVLELTDSPFWVGLVSAGSALPILLFSLPGGVVADRVDRRRFLVFTRTGMAASLLLLGLLTSGGWVNAWEILAVSITIGLLSAFDIPTRQALVPELVEPQDLANAVALNSSVFNASQLTGPAMAALGIGFLGVAGGFYLAAAGNMGMILALSLMRPSRSRPIRDGSAPWRDLVQGLKYIRRGGVMMSLVLLATASSLFGSVYLALMPVFTRDVLGGQAQDYGILLTASGVGSLAGAVLLAAQGDFRKRGMFLVASALAYGLAQMAFSLSNNYSLSLLTLGAAGAFSAYQAALTQALLLLLAPKELHGRVMSVFMLPWGMASLSTLASGAIAEALGVSLTVFLAGAACALFTLGLTLRRRDLLRA